MPSIVMQGEVVWPDSKPPVFDWEERGWWRMKNKVGYEERQNTDYDRQDNVVSTRKVPTGAMACRGEMYRLEPLAFKPSPGWKLVSQTTEKRKVHISFTNPASGGGGISYKIDPKEVDLWSAQLKPYEEYVVMMSDAWDSPYSEWSVPKPKGTKKPKREAMWTVRMDPLLWIEVTKAVLLEEKSGKQKTVEQPTGWAMAAGRFHRPN